MGQDPRGPARTLKDPETLTPRLEGNLRHLKLHSKVIETLLHEE